MLRRVKGWFQKEPSLYVSEELFPRSELRLGIFLQIVIKSTPATSAHLPLPPDVHHEASRYWPCCAHSPQCSSCCRSFNSQSSSSMVQCSPRAAGPPVRPPGSTWRRGINIREDEE